MSKKLALITTIAATLTLTACASTFKSPDLPAGGPGATAVLEPKDFERGAPFLITAVDGQSRGIGWFSRFELTPGRRAITASVNSYSLRGESITRYFTAESGKTYLFVAQDRVTHWNFSIVEKDSGIRVDSVSQ